MSDDREGMTLHRQIYEGVRKYPHAFALAGILGFDCGMLFMLLIVLWRRV